MIILAVGMPRAGSGWHYNLIHDLMITAGATDAREIRRRYHLQSILTEVNCNIGVLSPRRLALVSVPALLGHTFVIKAHAGPTTTSRLMERVGLLRVAYIYRDPRDAMLSAWEYGQRALKQGRVNAFSHLVDFETSLEFMRQYVRIAEQWLAEPHVLTTRYEDLLTQYEKEARRLVEFLHLDWDHPSVQSVLQRYHPDRDVSGQAGLHFYKGKIGRFREAYSAEQQARLLEAFGDFLKRTRYESKDHEGR